MNEELRKILIPRVGNSRGAPMGRPNVDYYIDKAGDPVYLEVNADAAPFSLVRVYLDAGGYDSGGAYWGNGCNQRLYGFVGPLTDIRGFVWARDRETAKIAVRDIHPHARFFR